MPIVREMNDIPESEIAEVVADFESEGCSTKKEKQDNGLWTVKATCPDKKLE